jgi:xanthine/uracil/vitamin C permease (AzgA family)
VTGVLFLLAILLSPLANLVPESGHGTGPGPRRLPDVHLVKDINVADIEDGLPAL